MNNFFKAARAGIRGVTEAVGPGKFKAAGVVLICHHCRGEIFERRTAQLNTPGSTFLHLDWLDRSGAAMVCTNCGLIHWFSKEPERL